MVPKGSNFTTGMEASVLGFLLTYKAGHRVFESPGTTEVTVSEVTVSYAAVCQSPGFAEAGLSSVRHQLLP